MLAFAVKRLGLAVAALVVIAILVFFIQVHFLYHVLHLTPAAALAYPHDTPKRVAELNRELGLTASLPVQFLRWAGTLWKAGGLGHTVLYILPPTLELLASGVVLAFCAALGLALLAVRAAGHPLDRLIDALAGLFSVVPSFWLASLLLFVFTMELGWLPGNGYPLPGQSPFLWAYHDILPVTVLTVSLVGPWTRTLRASLLENAQADYVRTARAKGVPDHLVRSRHMLKNSVLPLVTLIGLSLPTTLNTIVVIEVIFYIPGIGQAFYSALTGLFFANATTLALVLAMVSLFGNAVVDLAYGVLDPRITYQ
jgi:peptide/nickel transport system permease protein